ARAQDLFGGVVGVGPQQLCAPLAIAVGVDHDARSAGSFGEHDALSEMLHRVDRLTAPADEQPDVAALDAPAQYARALLDVDLHVDAQRVHDLLEQLFERLGGLQLIRQRLGPGVAFLVAHRRRPERFFFLRGGRGGGAELRSAAPTPARAGSPLGPRPRAGGALPSGEGPPPVPLPGGAGGAPMYCRISSCWPIVHRFVVIQYVSSPAG